MKRPSLPRALLVATGVLLLAPGGHAAAQTSASGEAPWLELPGGWSRLVENGVVVAVPGDLPSGASFLLMVEPVRTLPPVGLETEYDQAVADLGPWSPVGSPSDQAPGGAGWMFRLGTGVTRLNGKPYTALTAVARRGSLRARFWVLADTDDTYNRYQSAFTNAIASVQDYTAPSQALPPAPPRTDVAPAGGGTPRFEHPAFEGISGIYTGLVRGLSATASAGGLTTTFDPQTGSLGSAYSSAAPSMGTTISDSQERVLVLPDGTFRWGLPERGLDSDLSWDRRTIPSRWGTWRQKGDRIVMVREGSTDAYTVRNGELVDERGRSWTKVRELPWQHIDGTWVREDFRDASAPRLILRSDGSYEDRGGFLHMAGGAIGLVVPDGWENISRWSGAEADRYLGPSTGTYRLEDFTLTLNATDGRVWKLNAYLPPDASSDDLNVMMLNTLRLVRQ
jgi:hypothetical protein